MDDQQPTVAGRDAILTAEQKRAATAAYGRAWRLANMDRSRESSRKWREANRDKHREYARKYREANPEKDMERYRAKRKIVDDWKSQPCVDCGNTYPPAAMDCDHVRDEKRAPVARLLGRTDAEIRAELAKCEPRCANCHRIRHADERGSI